MIELFSIFFLAILPNIDCIVFSKKYPTMACPSCAPQQLDRIAQVDRLLNLSVKRIRCGDAVLDTMANAVADNIVNAMADSNA